MDLMRGLAYWKVPLAWILTSIIYLKKEPVGLPNDLKETHLSTSSVQARQCAVVSSNLQPYATY